MWTHLRERDGKQGTWEGGGCAYRLIGKSPDIKFEVRFNARDQAGKMHIRWPRDYRGSRHDGGLIGGQS